jgi:hypothetical protein
MAMNLRAEVKRLKAPLPAADPGEPSVVFYLPDNGRDRPERQPASLPRSYPFGGGARVVTYDAGAP